MSRTSTGMTTSSSCGASTWRPTRVGRAGGSGSRRAPPTKSPCSVEDPNAFGITASVKPDAAQFDDGRFVQGNWRSRSTRVSLPDAPPATDLSRIPTAVSPTGKTRCSTTASKPDPVDIACRVINVLGDEFDLFVFHNEFRVDSQESGTPVRPHFGHAGKEGTGIDWDFGVPCGEGRLKAVWDLPVWMKSDHVVNENRYHDERTLDRSRASCCSPKNSRMLGPRTRRNLLEGEREPLFGNYCRCHLRRDHHRSCGVPLARGRSRRDR